jgi:hypothetical protein
MLFSIRYVSGRGEFHAGFWWGSVRERGHLDRLGVDWRIILKYSLKK